ncbi:MAG: DUF2794 domain-containing protein [Alphaproteobacteria bacterium]|nr:MAG: DUF2794 domain-containing protein [Alphaproteobacteria bacterium]
MMEESQIPDRPAGPARPLPVAFGREELNRILDLYGRMVAAGEWRDYAIDADREEAVFAVFRRASEVPLFRIVKRPQAAERQGAYAVIAMDGRILRRGRDLHSVLRMFERRLIRLVEE